MPPSKKPKERQPWLKRVLIPFWVFQSLFMLILIGVNAWEITETMAIPSVTTLIVMSFASVCMLLIIIEIVSFARRRLHPLAYLIYQVLKSTLCLTLFCISMVGIARNIRYGGAELYLLTGFIEIVVVLICFIGTLIYASIIYHRHRRRIPYHRSHQKTLDTETARYRGPFSDPTITTVDYSSSDPLTNPSPIINNKRDSSAAPEVGREDSIRKACRDGRWGGELDHENEIREMNAREGGEEGEGGGVSRGEGCGRRELGEGERWVVELSATRSVKEGGGRVELDADGGARW